MTDDKRFTTVELPKPTQWGIWYDGAYLSTYQVCILLNEYVDVKNENEQLKQEMQRLYNYFADWFDDRVLPSDFSEMWDFIKEDEKWD